MRDFLEVMLETAVGIFTGCAVFAGVFVETALFQQNILSEILRFGTGFLCVWTMASVMIPLLKLRIHMRKQGGNKK